MFPQGWEFDLRSSLVTIFATPLILLVITIALRNAKTLLTYFVEGVFYRVARATRHSIAARLTLKEYCKSQLSRGSQFLTVPAHEAIQLDIERVFVPLKLEMAGNLGRTVTHANLLSRGTRIRVVGDPGSGKSALSKKLFRDSCEEGRHRATRARLPILVELRELTIPPEVSTSELTTWLFGYLRERISREKLYKIEDCFDSIVETAGLLVLLDGLDEVTTPNYNRMSAAINGLSRVLATKGPGNVVLLTMRTHFHQQVRDDYSAEFPVAVFVQPFTPTDVYDFLNRWPFENSSTSEAVRLYQDLMDRPTLREMCTNPLVLSMYVARDQANKSLFNPDTRTEFYSEVTEELLVKRRLRQVGNTPAKITIKETREKILGSLAFEHLLNVEEPANSLSWVGAVKRVQELLQTTFQDAEQALHEIGKETGLIAEERSGESFRFIHLTFCEFLAAKEAVSGRIDGWNRLVSSSGDVPASQLRIRHARFLEVIPFACGLLPRVARSKALDDLLRNGDHGQVLRALLETKAYDHPAFRISIGQEYDRLRTTPVVKWDEHWLRSVHLLNVVLRDADLAAAHMPVQRIGVSIESFVQSIKGNSRAALQQLFTSLAVEDAAAALRLAQGAGIDFLSEMPELVVKHCDQAPFLGLILNRAFSEPGNLIIWSQVISEAALRSPVVHTHIAAQPLPSAWVESADRLPLDGRWYGLPYVQTTSHTVLLSLALNGLRKWQVLPESLLSVVADAPPPRRYMFLMRLRQTIIALTAGVIIWIAYSSLVAGQVRDIIYASASVLLVVALALWVITDEIRGAYSEIVNPGYPVARLFKYNIRGGIKESAWLDALLVKDFSEIQVKSVRVSSLGVRRAQTRLWSEVRELTSKIFGPPSSLRDAVRRLRSRRVALGMNVHVPILVHHEQAQFI